MFNYEAWNIDTDEQIYNGTSKKEMINELLDFTMNLEIDKEDVININEERLHNIGIKIYKTKISL